MKKLAVYPFNEHTNFMAKYSALIEDAEDIYFICPKNSDYDGTTIENHNITSDWQNAVKACDQIILLAGLGKSELYDEIIAFAEGKEILTDNYVYEQLDMPNKERVKKLRASSGRTYKTDEILHDIDIPVISVMSMGLENGKFNLQLGLREYFLKNNYKILQYGSKEISELFGFSNLPEFIYDDISFTKKVLLLNQHIYEDLLETDADVIIIGCPGGVMPYNKYIHNFFGEIPLIVSKALQIDINVISLYFSEKGSLSEEYIRSLEQLFRETFGCELNIFNFSNIFATYNDEKSRQEYYVIDKEAVEKEKPELKSHYIFSEQIKNSAEAAYEHIEGILKSSFEVV